jgi:hypothetical protein
MLSRIHIPSVSAKKLRFAALINCRRSLLESRLQPRLAALQDAFAC